MSVLYGLPSWHLQALEWFEANAGRTFAKRPFDVGLPIKVTHARKGIWRPARSRYAVSVVQSSRGIYADLDPIRDASEGTWRYFYYQQGKSQAELDDPSSVLENAAMLTCAADGVPVGVVIPADGGRGFEVLGLALVESFALGYFELVGPVTVSAAVGAGVAEAGATVTAALVGMELGEFDPSADQDHRLTVLAEVKRRQGGPRFRRALLHAYEGRCAMTRYDAPAALEAAHIVSYRGPQTNHPANGLLLRADMHDLFDQGMVAVETDSMRLRLAAELAGTKYERYEGQELWLPRDADARPSLEALERHRVSSAVG